MSLDRISAEQALSTLGSFSAVIDARSEGEYAEDHLPGAINWPSLHDEERKIVGTQYKQISAFEAKKLGASLVAKNIAEHIQREVLDKPKEWQPLVYCWRGGKRSGSLALILDQIGFKVTLVDGGYKAFRAALVADIPQLAARHQYRVVCGPTGSGKTRLLQALAAHGAQVLDLEALAHHRSSVLGMIPGLAQPSQKAFDSRIWAALRGFDPLLPVYIESESKKVGNVAVPEGLITAMRASPCLNLELPEDERVALLLEDYDFFVQNTEFFCDRLAALTEARGKATVQDWQARARSGELASVVRELLVLHYDPVYLQSMHRNFTQYDSAQQLSPRDHSVAAMSELAQSLLAKA
ncbi:tRNA 2-selenouridine synthase [Polaromonas sp. OV174]|uniref:tRNA 2-selenouridine(34) synthase MnmH n=1 Tax=Polaromonas sp. OV174 TaxID=1855300 RepID=UPI0008EAD7BF|nr:tRNA 2-selenouridine(34) synthase MnmH [Polaromonas sp. OV174]SFC41274.1 tRNA 2-selenouridine synthase [Polaromonas sp. OV174]